MNERIRNLAKDYLVHERFSRYGESIEEDYYEFYPDELQDFVDLIMKECVKIAYQNDIAKFTRDGYAIGLEIQKHFGVEDD